MFDTIVSSIPLHLFYTMPFSSFSTYVYGHFPPPPLSTSFYKSLSYLSSPHVVTLAAITLLPTLTFHPTLICLGFSSVHFLLHLSHTSMFFLIHPFLLLIIHCFLNPTPFPFLLKHLHPFPSPLPHLSPPMLCHLYCSFLQFSFNSLLLNFLTLTTCSFFF